MAATQQITGLASGMDTASIVESLMSIERQSYDRTSEKVQAEKLRLQAYQSVNTMLQAFKTSVNSLASSSLWNSKTTSSTNESSLTATANQYATEGSYSLRVGQLATTAQYLSKGYSSATSTVLSSSSGATGGTITLESSKAKVDNSAKLEELNGGKGVYRGSIRITDANGATTVVDLSTCETIDEVVKEINSAAGVQIEARISETEGSGDRLEIVDLSGGAGVLKIQNVGQGTTATDLGIAGTSTDNNGEKSIVGNDIYYLSSNTNLSSLRDGLGIEQGAMCITVKGGAGSVEVVVDLSDAETVGDVLNCVNSALQEQAAAGGISADLLDGLKLAIDNASSSLTFTGGQAGNIYTVTEVWGSGQLANPLTATQLGLLGTYTVGADGESFGGERLLGDMSSPMLKNLSGANATGIGSESSQQKVSTDTLDADTLLKNLNGGSGIGDITNALQVRVYEGGGESYRQVDDILDYDELRALVTNENATLGDLVDYVNSKFASCGIPSLESIEVKIDSAGKGVYLDGLSSAHDYVIAGNLMDSLGLIFMDEGSAVDGWGAMIEGADTGAQALADLYSVAGIGPNGGASMVLGTTTLDSLTVNGADITQAELDAMLVDGGLALTIGSGFGAINVSVDLSGLTGDSTIDELISTINQAIYDQVKAVDPDMSVPFIDTDFHSAGLNWRNVDLSQDFSASGALATTLGIDKTYTDQGFAAVATSTQKNLNPVVTGVAAAEDIDGGQALASLNAGQGLSLLGEKLTLTFGEEGNQSIVSVTRDEIIAALGGNYGAAALDQYVAALNDLFAQKISEHVDLDGTGASVTFGISGNGIAVIDANGVNDGDSITLGGDMATAASTGLVAASFAGGSEFVAPEAADIRGVSVEEVAINGLGYIKMEVGGREVTLNADGLDGDSTLNDLIRTLNQQLQAEGLTDMYFTVSDSGTGLAFVNDSDNDVTIKYDEVSSLASDLGLVGTAAQKTDKTVASQGHLNGSSLNRNYVDRSTSLASLGVTTGSIQVTNAQGTPITIDFTDALTIGDVIDGINGSLYGVKARINDRGDGIIIEQTTDSKLDGSDGICAGNITIADVDGGGMAKALGIAGTGVGGDGKDGGDGLSRLDGSFKTVIEVGAKDTLTDIMNRIAALDAGYKTSIINDGTGTNSYRLSISASASGAANDFVIDTDLDIFGFQQVAKGQDSMVLYGQADSGMSPIMLKSSTNTNSQAINGLTLELNAVSDAYTTINVTADTSKVVEEIQNLVQTYNDLSDLITYLDSYDTENETDGILFGDTSIRQLMTTIDDMFYQVYNPNGLTYSQIAGSGTKQTWTWMDLGISFSSNNTNSDGESGSWYSRMELDLDVLNEMVTSNWDAMKSMLSSTRNVSDSSLSQNVAASASFNFKYDTDENGNVVKPDDQCDPNLAINGDKSGSGWGTTNGFEANKTIAEGENQYTVYFQQASTVERVSIYHPNGSDMPASEYALSDFTVEYLDANTGKWVTLREISGNTSSSTILGVSPPTAILGLRITASSTNAEDGKFRLLDVQCLESTGLAGKLNQTVSSLTDVVDGWFVSVNEEVDEAIADLQEQMEKQLERLEKKEESLWRQFNNMESMLSQLQNQGNYITSMLSSLSSSSAS